MKPEWRKSILPTLYDKFFSSKDPYSQFFKGSDAFVALLQSIIDEVFPGFTYIAYNRINKKCSHIGAAAVEAVNKHISIVTAQSGERAAREWLRWAVRADGPLFFKVPVPMDAPVNCTDPKYKHPEGRLLSKFIIKLAAPCLRLQKGSVSKNGYPKGLFALILTALERAVWLCLKPSKEIKEFLNEAWGSEVTVYRSSLRAIDEACWKEISDTCGAKEGALDDLDDENNADLSLLDNNRAFLFDFASPSKP
ncbi:hypothetical protein B0H34DRAFT_770560 [Crassisporium funariophilum]|nr:hypothetical protein B0H34DRAFT_770560 [Crassisporium funariophilum]